MKTKYSTHIIYSTLFAINDSKEKQYVQQHYKVL